MHRSIVVAVSLLLFAASSFAQQLPPSNTVSVFVSDLSLSGSDSTRFRSDTGVGAAIDHRFNDRVSGELSMTRESFQRHIAELTTTGIPASYDRTVRFYPIDASLFYHFGNASHWKPYLGAGLRYVGSSEHVSGPLGGYDLTSRAIAPEISAGITYKLRSNLGVRVDAKRIAGGMRSYITKPIFEHSDAFNFEPPFSASIGVGYSF
ncbi:MAG TPA: OmpW family outer membrane protein [Thermoanaerobaculia bacterium]|jgi:outer membrane protein W|nr:OmpW family outer membrane protein [Thermoanaerobaculia bacterium]